MTDTAEYITLLVISIVITIAVGRVLMMSGATVPAGGVPGRAGDDLGQPAAVGAVPPHHHRRPDDHLGVEIDVGSQLQNMVVKLGIVLIVLGIAYGVSMLVLIRVRQQRRADQISEEVQLKLSDRGISTHPASTYPPAPPAHPRPARGPAERPVTLHPGLRPHESGVRQIESDDAALVRRALVSVAAQAAATATATPTSTAAATNDVTAEPWTNAAVAASTSRWPSRPPTRSPARPRRRGSPGRPRRTPGRCWWARPERRA